MTTVYVLWQHDYEPHIAYIIGVYATLEAARRAAPNTEGKHWHRLDPDPGGNLGANWLLIRPEGEGSIRLFEDGITSIEEAPVLGAEAES
jgi:hypothetical protein